MGRKPKPPEQRMVFFTARVGDVASEIRGASRDFQIDSLSVAQAIGRRPTTCDKAAAGVAVVARWPREHLSRSRREPVADGDRGRIGAAGLNDFAGGAPQ